jgi:hypothetical protein
VFYYGNGNNDYAVIADFQTGDKILVGGSVNQYRFTYPLDTKNAKINTNIYYGNDLIATVLGGGGITSSSFITLGSSNSSSNNPNLNTSNSLLQALSDTVGGYIASLPSVVPV